MKIPLRKISKNIDILCVGEVLIDFIGHQNDVFINNTRDYHRYLGGSPTNVSLNCKRLGLNSVLVSTIGKDGFGEYIINRLHEVGINSIHINQLPENNTSVIFVSKSNATPDFIPYRDADSCIFESQISNKLLSETKIFHTTCFALSKNPAQTTILNKASEAFDLGCKLSIDVNYSGKLWDSKKKAIQTIKLYCKLNPLVKISEDDMERLFHKNISHQEIFDFFHNEGVDIVCLTLGSKGVILSEKNKGIIQLPAIKVHEILDTTGAGDAFWSGFLFAYIKEKTLEDCLKIALKLAALKLQNVGRLPENINILSKILD
ncbi:MAG: carbohydrate kinase [Flavobacteriia bacterium]|nr:carbohydrate kinase [Flavobacteriia bacterium]OIP48161.1 MAG: carbohydrate kinase [Flavobacteriaceae bacterium CG2_30_31_66]PIV97867.1 MAG: carbohydrate kinase [Flavobacteriaceae bacterium CG17_big_fil_post_rev_8_21_14_2_50_31_13]PIY14608.1 MAG: carbohydrate kinase [Flavobacteriaceae bacterium CG_4_10_14_3_um_filter_31_253]PIZ10875.1 MAG: carbohydrate kinase [Flavobacteriaceae bacterium CG_4_10_14_0_8_um_filter_31_99]PJC08682.1 MAG: carbohydrate kinase [Flavobacteriaceae bacterium CG_4_9_14